MTIHRPDPTAYEAAATAAMRRTRRGVLVGTGADRLDLLHRLSTNATRDLAPGAETTTILTSEKGRIIDVVRVLALEDGVLLVTALEDAGPTAAWLDKYTIMDDFRTEDVTTDVGTVSIYGARARAVVEQLLGAPAPDAGAFARAEVEGGELFVARDARIGGAAGFLLVISREAEERLLTALAGAGVAELPDETWHALRVEAGQPAIGAELDERVNPLEAGLHELVSFTKGCYIGQEVIARLDSYDKVQRHLVGLTLEHEPRGGDEDPSVVSADDGAVIGRLTSAAWSPSLGRTIALAYVKTQEAIPGAGVLVRSDGGDVPATITRLPFDA